MYPKGVRYIERILNEIELVMLVKKLFIAISFDKVNIKGHKYRFRFANYLYVRLLFLTYCDSNWSGKISCFWIALISLTFNNVLKSPYFVGVYFHGVSGYFISTSAVYSTDPVCSLWKQQSEYVRRLKCPLALSSTRKKPCELLMEKLHYQ